MKVVAAPFSTPETRGALERVKAFVRAEIGAEDIDERALLLVGETNEKVEGQIARWCDELRDELIAADAPNKRAFGFSFAFAVLVCERLAELEAQGKGRA